MKSKSPAAPLNVRAVSRALAILNSFAGNRLQTLAEVTRATKLDKGTTRRLLLTLMANGFVVQDAATQSYGLGRAIRALAADVVENPDVRTVAAPILTDLATDLKMTTFLSVYHDSSAICLDRIHDTMGLSMEVRWWPVGGTMPLNCGGAPKLLLAYQSPDEINKALLKPLEAMTVKSIRSKRELKDQLLKIKKRGWEFAVDDVVVGLSSLAVPVLDREDKIVCAVSVSGLTPQMVTRGGPPAALNRMLAAAEQIRKGLQN